MNFALEELDGSLREALEPPYSGNKHVLVQALLEAKPRVLKLFDVGPKNDAEKREVEAGMCCCNPEVLWGLYLPRSRRKYQALEWQIFGPQRGLRPWRAVPITTARLLRALLRPTPESYLDAGADNNFDAPPGAGRRGTPR